MYHYGSGHLAFHDGFTDQLSAYTPQIFFGLGGAATLFASGAMSYYADEADGYRVPGYMAEPGNITLITDLRTQVIGLSVLLAGIGMRVPFAGLLVPVSGALGAAALMSLVSTEGQRWAEGDGYFGINIPALPALPGQPAKAAELAVVENLNATAAG